MNYQDAFAQLGLEPTDCVYVASSSLSYFWNPDFVRDITESLLDYFKYGTIVMPAFSSDFRRNGSFDVANSTSICGRIAEYFRSLSCVSRSTFSPLHTVCCTGKLSDSIISRRAESSYGSTSVFSLLKDVDASVILIDCSFFDGVPFINCLEEQYQAPYRYWKKLSGKIIYADGAKEKIDIMWYAKCLDFIPPGCTQFDAKLRRNCLTELGKHFYSEKIVESLLYNRTKFVNFKISSFYTFFEPLIAADKNAFVRRIAD